MQLEAKIFTLVHTAEFKTWIHESHPLGRSILFTTEGARVLKCRPQDLRVGLDNYTG